MNNTPEQLRAEAERIQAYLEITASDDPNELVARLSDLNVYLARTGRMLAEASCIRDRAVAAVYASRAEVIERMPATVARRFVDSQTADENELVVWLDRLNRTCTHQSENLRTQISFAKQQLELTRKGY
ncbi:MAG: hypothetical protein K2G93_08260 [Rikenella sp.]|nr:hypothetical protein [Rikenella sp.]